MNETTEQTGQAPDTSQPTGQAPEGTPATPETTEQRNEGSLPKWVQKELADARAEAAKARDERRERERKAAEDAGNYKKLYEDLHTEVSQERSTRLRSDIAREFSLPAELAARLQGDDEDTLRQDAQTLASFLKPATPTAPSTGATLPGRTVKPEGIEAQVDSEWSKFYQGRKPGIRI